MKKILAVGATVLGGLILVWLLLTFGLSHPSPQPTPSEYAAREAQAQATATAVAIAGDEALRQASQRADRDRWVQPAITLLYLVAIVTAAAFVVLAVAGLTLAAWHRRHPLILVAGEPVARRLVEQGNYPSITYDIVRARGVAEIEAARRPVYPQTYSPHITDSHKYEALPPGESERVAAIAPPAERLQLTEVLRQLPHNGLLIPFGSDDSGKLLTRPLEYAVHILLAGGSGAGKSFMAQSGVTGLLTANDPEIFKLACFDVEGQTSQPFKPHAAIYADEGRDILAGMEELCHEIDRRQLAGRNVLDWRPLEQGYPVYLALVEEAASLIDEVKMLGREEYTRYVAALKKLAVRGRKWGIFLLQLKQADYSEPDFRLAQGQFATRLVGYCKPTAGRSLGFTNTDALNELWRQKERGRFLMEGPDGDRFIWSPLLNRQELPAIIARYRRSSGVQDEGADLNADLNVQLNVIDAQALNVQSVQAKQPSQAQDDTQAMNVQAFNFTAAQQSQILALARAGMAKSKICDMVLGGRGRYNELKAFLDIEGVQQ